MHGQLGVGMGNSVYAWSAKKGAAIGAWRFTLDNLKLPRNLTYFIGSMVLSRGGVVLNLFWCFLSAGSASIVVNKAALCCKAVGGIKYLNR